MRIISASRRTDIPAFYSRWLLNRLRAGFCHWINPFGGQVYRLSLRPEDCLAIVFWTRNPAPLLPHLHDLHERGYHFYFHVTINGYPLPIETHGPPQAAAVAAFQRLSDSISPDLSLWRYDPIVLSDLTPPAYHMEQFDALSRQLQGYTKRCYFAFVDFYGKTERNLKQLSLANGLTFQRPLVDEQRSLVQALRRIAAGRGITLYSCCDKELVGEGVQRAHCIHLDLIRRVRGDPQLRVASAPSRQDCGCLSAADIGAYDTCAFGCTYCYATNSRAAALQRTHEHDAEDSVLWRPASLRGVDLAARERPPAAT